MPIRLRAENTRQRRFARRQLSSALRLGLNADIGFPRDCHGRSTLTSACTVECSVTLQGNINSVTIQLPGQRPPISRTENMRRIRSSSTKLELSVRRFLHSKGFRYRLNVASLPGKPDLVFPALGTCLFVHGCFWHGCTKCVDGTRQVRTRRGYWTSKIAGNRRRDRKHIRRLRRLGWRVFVLWGCQITPRRLQSVAARLERARAER